MPQHHPYAPFRLNLEQQKKRAKELLKLAQTGNAEALQRIQFCHHESESRLKLATAQHCIAKELRFANWAALKQHIQQMEEQRTLADNAEDVLDADMRTMHIRCGHDIQDALVRAGFHGDFNLHINPYLEGPVTDAPDWLEQRARFIAESFGPSMNLEYDNVLRECRGEEQRLADARNYERVLMWFEHDRYDQFVLLRCLAFFAANGMPPLLQLVSANDFPGNGRFLGLGQLPPEALRILWQQRSTLGSEHLLYASSVWDAFRSPDPSQLVTFMKAASPLLPDLPLSLKRHLQELPSVCNGLGLTQQLILQVLADHGPQQRGSLPGLVMHYDPLPGAGDLSIELILKELAVLPNSPVERLSRSSADERHGRTFGITETGHHLLAGKLNLMDFPVKERWVGGICVTPGKHHWCWDEAQQSCSAQ